MIIAGEKAILLRVKYSYETYSGEETIFSEVNMWAGGPRYLKDKMVFVTSGDQ
jgi:hypothetical protein